MAIKLQYDGVKDHPKIGDKVVVVFKDQTNDSEVNRAVYSIKAIELHKVITSAGADGYSVVTLETK